MTLIMVEEGTPMVLFLLGRLLSENQTIAILQPPATLCSTRFSNEDIRLSSKVDLVPGAYLSPHHG
jgi:hypothetical protein